MWIMRSPCIIHEDIQLAMVLCNVFDQSFDRHRIGVITLDGLRSASGGVDRIDGVVNRRSR